MAGIRQRTGTLLAAHALVASFLGGTTIRAEGLEALSWLALACTTIRAEGLEALSWLALASLVAGLVLAAVLLAPWRLRFAIDAKVLYDELYEEAAAEAEANTLGWLAAAGFGYQALRSRNTRRVRWMSALSGVLAVLMIVQTLAWLSALSVH